VSGGRWDELVERALRDENVVGLFLSGSRGKGAFVTPDSDYDVRLVVRDELLAEYEDRFPLRRGDALEILVCSGAELRAWPEWDRYSFAHVRAVLDPDGEIQGLIDAKGRLAGDEARALAAAQLDAYVNALYRSAKSLESGRALEGRLDAAESVPPFLTALFALHGRLRPFNGYLRWELETHPLAAGPPWRAGALLPRLERIAADGDLDEQRALFRDVETIARERGHGAVIDGWEPDVAWLRG
jgi:hypothetical protein